MDRIPVDLEISPGGTPKTLVERAAELKREANRKANSRNDVNSRYDEVWCVFDIDEHPFVPDAKQQAQQHQIKVAISNPCFELWVLLHFQDQQAHIERGAVQHLCRQYLPGYSKRLPYEQLAPLYDQARRRAGDLAAWQATRGGEGSNPSTAVYKLTERIKTIAQKKQGISD